MIAGLMRGIAATLNCRVVDATGADIHSGERVIWVFWHNRMFLMPWMWQSIFPNRQAAILTSPSGDGGVIAQTCAEFNLKAVRGSSSRRGGQALIELAKLVKAGHDIGVTPDGPRGPKYEMNMGVIKLAQLTGLKIVPIHVRYTEAFRFNTWDQFLLPKPFSKVNIELGQAITVPREAKEEECESLLKEIENVMRKGSP